MRTMRLLAGRAPRRVEVGLTVVWLALMGAASFASVPFALGCFLVLLDAPPHGGIDELIVVSLGSAAIGVCGGLIAMGCYAVSAIAARAPGAQATWLRGAAQANGWLTRALWVMLALSVLALFGIALRADFRQGTAQLLLAAPAAGLVVEVTSVAQVRLRVIGARAGRWVRRSCLGCGYDMTGLVRCPECGAEGLALRTPRV